MTTGEALLAAVCAAPDDHLPRLVLADHLDEQGEHERAEFVRLQCQMFRLPDCNLCVGSSEPVVGPVPVVPCPVCEGPDLLRRQNALLAPDLLPALLDPADRDSFDLVSYRPAFERGFLGGVAFPNFDPFHFDPPLFPFEAVGGDWYRLCDLMARNPLVNRVECPDWFRIVVTPTNGGWQARLSFLTPQLCPHCRGQTGRGGVSCMECHGGGTRRDEEYHTDTRDRIINLVVRDQIARSLPLVLADDRFAG